jgi:hypothetical protein
MIVDQYCTIFFSKCEMLSFQYPGERSSRRACRATPGTRIQRGGGGMKAWYFMEP